MPSEVAFFNFMSIRIYIFCIYMIVPGKNQNFTFINKSSRMIIGNMFSNLLFTSCLYLFSMTHREERREILCFEMLKISQFTQPGKSD